MRAAPDLSLELRTAIIPSGNSANSTQLPLGLLALLLRQRAALRRSALMPFSTCIFAPVSAFSGDSEGRTLTPAPAAVVCTRQPNMLMHVHSVLASRARARQNAFCIRLHSNPSGERRVGSVRGGGDGGTCGSRARGCPCGGLALADVCRGDGR